jgi:hypothetical protein
MIARKSKVLSPSLLALPLSLSSLAFDPPSLPHLRFDSSGEGEQRRGSAAQRMGGSRREGYLVIDLIWRGSVTITMEARLASRSKFSVTQRRQRWRWLSSDLARLEDGKDGGDGGGYSTKLGDGDEGDWRELLDECDTGILLPGFNILVCKFLFRASVGLKFWKRYRTEILLNLEQKLVKSK